MFKLGQKWFLIITFIILAIGVLFRLALTWDGNFLFNMDSARDFVMVREMVELKKLRLTGPNTPIDGFYDGPFWYYLLALPYFISKGDPYSAVLMQIIFWLVGGFFLLKLVKNFGNLVMIAVGSLWIASNYLVLANLYSFNPSPVTLLSPLLIYLLVRYLQEGSGKYIVLAWFLSGLFFNLEMNFGLFMPPIILASVIFSKKTKLLKQKWFWLGLAGFIATILPQIIFDFKHQFIMSQALLRHVAENSGSSLGVVNRSSVIALNFYNTFLPTLMNHQLLAWIILILFIPFMIGFLQAREKDLLVLVSLIFIFIPFLGYTMLPVAVNPWHLGAEMVAAVILLAYLLSRLMEGYLLIKAISIVLSVAVILFGFNNISHFFTVDWGKPSQDPSLYKNEIAAVDYVYKYANGKNFKVYSYLPSIIDYPYQYLIWQRGLKHFGYLPIDYAYAPNKPTYISSKAAFSATKDMLEKRASSNLVFLIKEPDRNYTRLGWEGEFVKLKSLGKQMVGPLEIDIRQDFSQ